MFGLRLSDENAEYMCRRIHALGLTVAGERGGEIANKVTEVIGLGSIGLCDDPDCEDCAPIS